MSRFLHPSLQRLEQYQPGEQPTVSNLIKLNTNELPYPCPPGVIKAVSDCVGGLNLYNDPNANGLCRQIAEHYNLPVDNVFVSNGSDEALAFIFQGLCPNGVAFADVTYGFYRVLSCLFSLETDIIPLHRDFSLDIADYERTTRTVVIANPNPPCGLAVTTGDIEALAQQNSERLVVVDEAYIDFSDQTSACELCDRYDNLLIVGTFSKSYGLAGARLGYALGCADIVQDLNRVRFSFNPYSVSQPAQYAGIEALRADEYYQACRAKVIATRARVQLALRALGFECTDSMGNFVFATHSEYDAKTLFEKLRQNYILVRWFDTKRTANFLRISVGSDAEMDVLLAALGWLLVE